MTKIIAVLYNFVHIYQMINLSIPSVCSYVFGKISMVGIQPHVIQTGANITNVHNIIGLYT